MNVPFLRLSDATTEIATSIGVAIERVVSSGWYVGGPEVADFEKEWACYCEAGHAVGLGNGLDALHLALRALDIGSGDEVITASNGYIATLLAISMSGANPVLVEPNLDTHTLDPDRITEKITSRTKAIIPTHLYGHPADLEPILAIAKSHSLRVIEDAAQAHGARYKEKRIGAHGDVVCWSFYPSKNLGALGDGGAITTDDYTIAERVRELGNYGSKERYVNREKGVNSRLDPLQAAILRAKLPMLDEWNKRRKAIASHYCEAMADTPIVLPRVATWAEPVWHLFVIRSHHRDDLARHLNLRGIQTLIHYPIPPHRQHAYRELGLGAGSLPIAEQFANQVLSLPIGPHLKIQEVEAVIAAVRSSSQHSTKPWENQASSTK